ncbi:MAG: MltA domain-containing protein [candidate division WOR-3 bacterium]|nr:MAG: MltA domain-containing protein [candidate division WOR-3 bacterium]
MRGRYLYLVAPVSIISLALLTLLAGSNSTGGSWHLVRLAPHQWPRFTDGGSASGLRLALEQESVWLDTADLPDKFVIGGRVITREKLKATVVRFLEFLDATPGTDLNRYIEANFEVYACVADRGLAAARFTGYYNPEVPASRDSTAEFRYPLYRFPRNARSRSTRKQIEEDGVLRGYEIAWLKDPFDRYALHIEGSGTLEFPDSTRINAHYAGSNRRSYTSLGTEMLRDGLLAPGEATMPGIREWFKFHPDRLQEYLNRNRSYVYFRLDSGPPSGSTGLPLVPERSIATHQRYCPPGMLCWVSTRVPRVDSAGRTTGSRSWSRFVLNIDKGAAIKGPNRVDIFFGSGDDAQLYADRLDQTGRFYMLVAKDQPGMKVADRLSSR